jgi:hypothetical protein
MAAVAVAATEVAAMAAAVVMVAAAAAAVAEAAAAADVAGKPSNHTVKEAPNSGAFFVVARGSLSKARPRSYMASAAHSVRNLTRNVPSPTVKKAVFMKRRSHL